MVPSTFTSRGPTKNEDSNLSSKNPGATQRIGDRTCSLRRSHCRYKLRFVFVFWICVCKTPMGFYLVLNTHIQLVHACDIWQSGYFKLEVALLIALSIWHSRSVAAKCTGRIPSTDRITSRRSWTWMEQHYSYKSDFPIYLKTKCIATFLQISQNNKRLIIGHPNNL